MYVYILKSLKYKKYYIGLSANVGRRLLEHSSGWVKKTKFYRPFKLIYVEIVNNRLEARNLEKYFKSGYGKDIIREIERESKI